ncbi:MAG: hypothetical protein FD174_2780 [Geobacteraceae bacterium]|nr:MAG: hypothetical protein FD174_2780 [Geobacteraceae bacterium]
MINLFITILTICVSLGSTAHGHEILVLQSLQVKPYEEALRGFKSACSADMRRLTVSDMEGADLTRTIHEERPGLILAIGADALKKIKRIKDIPIIYLMVLNPQQIAGGGKNITGVSMNIPPEKYLALLRKILAPPKMVGLLYDPVKTGSLVKKAQQAAGMMGIELLAKEVRRSKDVPELLNGMKGAINAFWMLPDTTVVTPETVEFFLLFSQEHKIPILTFANKYVEMGALISLDIDAFDLGRQAGEMAKKALEGTPVRDLPRSDARRSVLKINRNVARKLGINPDTIE